MGAVVAENGAAEDRCPCARKKDMEIVPICPHASAADLSQKQGLSSVPTEAVLGR